MRCRTLASLLLPCLLLWPRPGQAKAFAYGARLLGRYGGVTIGLDPYKSYASVYYDIKSSPSHQADTRDEVALYRKLFLLSLRPHYVLVQATHYTVAHTASVLKRDCPRDYRRLDWDLLGKKTNLLEALASGYEEPYAFSAFVGYLTPFWRADSSEAKRQTGCAIAGFVASIGDRHIRSLLLLRDNWYELGWTLKGARRAHSGYLEWNAQLGVKFHEAPEVFDVVLLAVSREHLDRGFRGLSALRNSSFGYRAELPLDWLSGGGRPERLFSLHYLEVGAKLPSARWPRIVYAVSVGLRWRRYKTHPRPGDRQECLHIFVRPNVHF